MVHGLTRKVNVLVFPCGTEIGLEIHRSLCFSTHIKVLGAHSVEPNHGAYVFEHYLPLLPMVQDPLFLGALKECLERHRIECIYPAHDDAVLELARRAQELNCTVIGSPKETCELCRSKSATYAKFRGSLPVPRQFSIAKSPSVFPIFVKPDRGQGSQNARKVNSLEEWNVALRSEPGLISMEYLPGEEYTVDCFTDRFGRLRYTGMRQRIKTVNGISVHTRSVTDAVLQNAAALINRELTLRGAWFFQMKRNAQGDLVLLEIAPRVSGGMGLNRAKGINLPLLSVYDALNLDVELYPMPGDVEMNRFLTARFTLAVSYDHVYIDLDDTIIREGGINPLVLAFLYQCRNRGKGLHLLTRNTGNIDEMLAALGMGALFESVQFVALGQPKSDYIHHQSAIFIDDSFSERKQVYEAVGIPVYGPDTIEVLMDWRC